MGKNSINLLGELFGFTVLLVNQIDDRCKKGERFHLSCQRVLYQNVDRAIEKVKVLADEINIGMVIKHGRVSSVISNM